MTTGEKISITSSELGTVWNAYLMVSGRTIVFDFFKERTIEKEAKNIFVSLSKEGQNLKTQITDIFNNEKAAIPIGFNERDVIWEAPALYDDIFHIVFLRQMMKLNIGVDAVFTAIAFKKEVQELFKLHHDISYNYYVMATDYLLRKGVLAKPPAVTMPTEVKFIEDESYMSGLNLISDKRALNTVEVGYLYEALEFNFFFMKLLTGFAQAAKEEDVKKYFSDGIELAKKNVDKFSDVMIKSDMEPSLTSAGRATDSTISPFSDKLMMYITSLLTTTPLSYSGLGTSFSFRSDIPLLLGAMAKDLFSYAKEGGKLMIRYRWMEEPPQMEDRNQLIKSKQ